MTESTPAERGAETRAGKTVLLALSAAFGAPGGIQMYGRLLIKASIEIAGETGGRSAILILNDRPADVDARYTSGHAVSACSGSKIRFMASLVRLVLAVRPDVIIFGLVNFGGLSLLTRPLCLRSEHWFMAYGIEVWRRLPVIRRSALRRAERVLAISGFTGREAVAHNALDPARVSLLPCALDPVWAEDAGQAGSGGRVSQDGSTLLTVARMIGSERYKGVEEVLRALPSVQRQFPEVRYVVVGDGDDRPRLQELAKQLGLSETVEFRGRIGAAELARTYVSASVFVMPSSREGFGIVFLEAAFFGLPSIASTEGGSREVVIAEKTGLLVNPGDIETLSSAIIDLLSSKDRREQLGRQAHEHVKDVYSFARFKLVLKGYLGS